MSTLSHAVTDSATMLRRNLRHMQRYPSMTLLILGMPVIFLLLLPFLGSGFVPTGSMPAGVRWFAEYQPFTPATETVRGLLLGTPIGHNAIIAVAWCAGIALLGYLWARRLYIRHPVR